MSRYSSSSGSGGIEVLLGGLFLLAFVLGMITLVIFVWGMIFKRAGYSFAMARLMFIPLVNLIWLLIFAFSKWPIEKELEMYRTRGFPVGTYPQQGAGYVGGGSRDAR